MDFAGTALGKGVCFFTAFECVVAGKDPRGIAVGLGSLFEFLKSFFNFNNNTAFGGKSFFFKAFEGVDEDDNKPVFRLGIVLSEFLISLFKFIKFIKFGDMKFFFKAFE